MNERLLSRSDLCEKIGMNPSSLRKYISRGTIKEAKKGIIDIEDEFNKECLINYASKKGIDIINLLYQEEKTQPESTKKTTWASL